jgi:hypothetical protein
MFLYVILIKYDRPPSLSNSIGESVVKKKSACSANEKQFKVIVVRSKIVSAICRIVRLIKNSDFRISCHIAAARAICTEFSAREVPGGASHDAYACD